MQGWGLELLETMLELERVQVSQGGVSGLCAETAVLTGRGWGLAEKGAQRSLSFVEERVSVKERQVRAVSSWRAVPAGETDSRAHRSVG